MFNELYQSFPVFASLAQILNNPVAKIAFVPPFRRNGVGIPLNLRVRQRAEFLFEWSEIQPTATQTPVKNMLFEKLETLGLFCTQPRLGRSADNRQGQKRKCLLVVVNAKAIRTRPKIWIHCPPICVLNQRVESKYVRCLIPLHAVRFTSGRPSGKTRAKVDRTKV